MLKMQVVETIGRSRALEAVERRAEANPVVLLLGPRQCGKTTLARQFASRHDAEYFDLEDPQTFDRLENPMTALAPLRGWIVLDEAQLRPEIFATLRVLADRAPLPARFLVLGSASPDLIRGASESLAGRVALVPLSGFDLSEVGTDRLRQLHFRGGLPRSFLAKSDLESREWRADFIQTFLERDLRRFGVQVAPLAMRRFWSMTAHHHGQIWNASEIGRSLGEAHTTVKRHLEILSGALVMRTLPAWFENLGKRQVKSPKVFLRDSGLLHELLGVPSFAALEGHPKLGASWEGFALEEVLRVTGERDAYFWHAQSGAELDLLVLRDGRRLGFEFKYSDSPRISKSLAIARSDLKLDHTFVVHPGSASYAIDDATEAVGIGALRERLEFVPSLRGSPGSFT